MVPEIWCAMEDEQMDKPMDKKSDTEVGALPKNNVRAKVV